MNAAGHHHALRVAIGHLSRTGHIEERAALVPFEANRQASKAASRQRRWLANPENRDYFRGAEQVARAQCWRAQHPRYGCRASTATTVALQDDRPAQAIENKRNRHVWQETRYTKSSRRNRPS